MRAIVIEDMQESRDLVATVLSEDGYEVVAANGGKAGIKAFEPGRFDLVVTDVLMPEADGLEVIKAIRQLDPDVPVIAISGGGETFAAVIALTAARAFGANEILYKPFRVADLRDAVTRVVKSGGGGRV